MKFVQKGFTLVELLIVIAVIGVLATIVLAAIDPIDKINSANDAKVQQDLSAIASGSEAYAARHDGFYPAVIGDLVTAGELKATLGAPTGYSAYAPQNVPAGCTAGTTCTGIIWTGQQKSKRYTASPVRRYESSTGKTCNVAAVGTACP